MNKKVILSWLSLVMLIITSAYVPVSAAANTNPSLSRPSQNVIQLIPEVRRVGFVVAYSPGQSITIVDRQGNQYTFELASALKIVPKHRADLLAPGAFVTIIAPNNVPGGKHIAVGIVIHPSVPPGFAGPISPPPTPNVPTEFPAPVVPYVPPEDKPSLSFSPAVLPALPALQAIVGYSFPGDFTNWAMPIRVAAFQNIIIDSAEIFTPVGVVEIGSDQNNPNIFLVEIDLTSTNTQVQGHLVSLTATGTVDVTFQRMPQIVNPERTDSPYEEFQGLSPAPASFSTIFADGVCFEATTVDGPIKYCSTTSALSVRDNFSPQYADLRDLISAAAAQFDLQNLIQLDQILSMQENVQHIQDCASELTQQACAADMIVAPVNEQYFEQKYNQKFGGDNGDDEGNGDDGDDGSSLLPTPFDVAVVKVLRTIDTANGPIQPGDYRMDYWFDSNGVFYAATLTGVTTNNTSVINQQIPAVPASLINANANGPQEPDAQISACRIFRRCAFWQSTCG